MSITNTQRLGLFTFEGVRGAYYSLNLASFSSASSGASVTATILKPDGTSFKNCGTYSATVGNCDTGALPSSGTFAVRIDASGTTAFSFNIVVSQDLTATLTVNAAPASYDVTVLGQNKRYAFAIAAAQPITLVFTNNTIGSGTIYVLKPDGSVLTNSNNYSGDSNWVMDLGVLTMTGTYTAVVYVDRVASGHINVSAVRDATGTVASNGTAASVSLLSGQNATYTFGGVAGQAYSLVFTSLSTIPSGGSLSAVILNPDGTTFKSCGTYTATTGNCDTSPLPTAGTYRIFIDPAGTAATSFNIVLSPDLSGTLTLNAAPVGYDVTIPGQNKRYGFTVTAGQPVTLVFTGNTIAAGTIYVFKPDGSLLTNSNNFGGTSSWVMDLGALAAAGTYTAVVFVDRVAAGHINVSAITDASGTAATDGTALSVSLLGGQNATYTFSGVAGQFYSLALVNLVRTPSGGTVAVVIRRPDGTVLRDCGTFTPTTGNCDTPAALTSGTYRIFIDPSGTAATSFNLVLSADLTGTMVINDPQFTFNATVPGRNIWYSFAGTASQQVSWRYSSNTIAKGTMIIYSPNGVALTGYHTYGGNASGVLAATLPTTGTYTAILYVDGAATGQINLQLQAP